MSNENNTSPAVPEEALTENTAVPESETKKKGRKKKKKEDDYTNPNNRKFVISTIVILCIVVVIAVFMALFCFVGNTWFAKVNLEDKTVAVSTYSEEQKQQAADAIVDFFSKNQQGSVLQEVNYSEYFSERTGRLSFEGRFYAIFSNLDSVKAPGSVHKNWHWDLEINPQTGQYEVVSYGVLKDVVNIGEEATAADAS